MEKFTIPKYTLAEELINSISHGIGAALGIAALVLTIVKAASHGNTIGVVAASIYGAALIVMYLVSCIYHALSPRLKAKKVFRVIDHCDIYTCIAGCYAPFCLSLIGGAKGWIIFAAVLACAVLGILLNSLGLEKYKKISVALYLFMGWIIIVSFPTLKAALPPKGLILLIGGGAAYSVGALIYTLGAKRKYLHSIFHFFVLAGSILHFFSIFLYAL